MFLLEEGEIYARSKQTIDLYLFNVAVLLYQVAREPKKCDTDTICAEECAKDETEEWRCTSKEFKDIVCRLFMPLFVFVCYLYVPGQSQMNQRDKKFIIGKSPSILVSTI